MPHLLEVREVFKTYGEEGLAVPALRGVSLRVDEGELVSIMGPSGSGKSTLMNILGCLDRPTSGTYLIEGRDVSGLTDNELADIRNRKMGFVFQTFNLLARATALDNVELPLIYRGLPPSRRRAMARDALSLVGMGHRLTHRPAQLSGGEQQRVAIARALAGNPRVLLADEPTGNLDTRTGEEIMSIFQRINSELGVTIVQVTHDPHRGRQTRRVVRMRDGRIVEDLPVPEDQFLVAEPRPAEGDPEGLPA
ncbi:MAG: ABC transporter ATP-binding protein [Firmicutes bacterium]|nr:ABC transporter ATP-binding protein [Bacillota bacterium]